MNKPFLLKNIFLKGFFALFAVSLLAACKDNSTNPASTGAIKNGAFVLNSGNYQQNNASITAFNFDNNTPTQNFFEQEIGRKLGETGNDMLRIGSRLYIVVNGSNKIEVVDLATWKSITKISLLKDGVESKPRQITVYNGNLFVSCWNHYVAVINTATFAVQWVEIPQDVQSVASEGIVELNGKIYVANSNYNGSYNPGSISIIDPNTLTVTGTIPSVGYNISDIAADGYGDLYVISRGNYSNVSPNLYVVDPVSKTVKKTYDIEAQHMEIKGNVGYVAVGGYDSNWNLVTKVETIDVSTDVVTNNELIPASRFQSFSGMNVDPVTGDIYCLDSHNYVVSGDAYCFGSDGSLKSALSFKTGVNPLKIVFYRN